LNYATVEIHEISEKNFGVRILSHFCIPTDCTFTKVYLRYGEVVFKLTSMTSAD